MSSAQPKQTSGFGLIVRKYFLSAFVVFSFAAYALHERSGNTDAAHVMVPTVQPIKQSTSVLVPTPTTATGSAGVPPKYPTAADTTAPIVPTDVPPTDVPPTAVPPTSTVANSLYRDGTYTGDVADAFYGNVQVQATIQGGKITDVQFLDYPQDRRTSQRINQVAVPYLKSEAVQAQSANVNIISGATLTSQAFMQSMQSALSKAHS